MPCGEAAFEPAQGALCGRLCCISGRTRASGRLEASRPQEMLSPVRGQLLAAAQMLRPKRQTLPTALARASAARLPRHEECARDGDPGLVLDVGEHARDDGLASSRVGVAQEPPHLKVAHRAVVKASVATHVATWAIFASHLAHPASRSAVHATLLSPTGPGWVWALARALRSPISCRVRGRRELCVQPPRLPERHRLDGKM